jgi:rhamnosyltransferase
VQALQHAGLKVVLVQNNSGHLSALPAALQRPNQRLRLIDNQNVGGVAGGFNRGVDAAIAGGAEWITLLDQDSRLLPEDLHRLREPWVGLTQPALLVGPLIWDGLRERLHAMVSAIKLQGYLHTRLLISSGTTFRAADWPRLGPMAEWLVVDFVDYIWCFRAQARQGFRLMQHPEVRLVQRFGRSHPNRLCRWLGMELYTPSRHFYQLRNLRWLLEQAEVPLNLRCKELLKMLLKPWLWLLCEPRRRENFAAILAALRAPLPGVGSF